MKELSLIGSRLDGRYDIQEQLGRGSYAEIFVARDNVAAPNVANRQVVIKALNVFMQNDLDADLERTLVENFQNEAIALDRVRHPNILSRLGHGTARDLRGTIFHYLVLEYLSGGDLQKATRERSLNAATVFSYLEQVCAGLAHAHQAGVIHRDIKPQNLLLTGDRTTVKIADFGVARFAQSDSPITRVGTNMYAPPEHSPMLADDGRHYEVAELTPAADIYSLAKTAYTLFTNESPRFFANRPVTELPYASRTEPWAEVLLAVLQKSTRNDPRERHQDVYEFWKDFSRLRTLVVGDDSEIGTLLGARVAATTPKAHISKGYTPLAPQRPDFNTSRELKIPNNQVLRNPALAVKIPSATPSIPNTVNTGSGTLTPAPVATPSVHAPAERPIEVSIPAADDHYEPRSGGRFLRRAGAVVIAVAAFTGVLFGTHSYLRGKGVLPEIRWPFSTTTGVTTTNINLRAAGDPDSQKIGLVPKNSRVRVVNSKDNWYEVDIVEFGGPKEKPTDAEHGWVNKKFVDLD